MLGGVKVLTAHEFGLAACQASIYTPDGDSPAVAVLGDLLPQWRDLFDAPPEVVAHPASPHPRILLGSATGQWRCEIAADRTDFYWLRRAARAPVPAIAEFFSTATEVLGHYAEVTGARVGRLAAIVNRVAAHDAPGRFLAGHLFRPELVGAGIDRTEALEVNLHHLRAMGPFQVNAWIRCRTPDDPRPAGRQMVLVTQDLNTLGEDAPSRRFTFPETDEFFTLAAREHEDTLGRFFPSV